MAPVPPVEADDLLGLAERAAEGAVALLVHGRTHALATVRSKSTATDMVSEMDHAAEEAIRAVLLGARPDDGFLGEETGLRPGTSGLTWVVDPLDGTTDYLYDHPGWNVSIACREDGAAQEGTIAAVVAIPQLGETFTATRGGGTRRNGQPVACSTIDALPAAHCATGFAYDPERRRRQATVLTAVLPRIRDVRRMGAAANDLCSVACGRVDAYWERGLGPWDVAAGALVAREAGATVLGDDGGAGSLVVAAGPGIFATLHDLLVDSGAADA
jgi:myo-inositol-1(or 4)-monophosphatase